MRILLIIFLFCSPAFAQFSHLSWEKTGRVFQDGNRFKIVSGVGTENLDLGSGIFAPYIWDGNSLIVAGLELRFSGDRFEVWRQGSKIGGFAFFQEARDGEAWVRKNPTKGQIISRNMDSGSSRSEIEVEYELTSLDQITTVYVKAGGRSQLKFGVKIKALTQGNHRVAVEFGTDGTPILEFDKKGQPLPATKLDFGDFIWAWEPKEQADHKIEGNKVFLGEKLYAARETKLIYPDVITPTLNANEDDGNDTGVWNVSGFVGMDFIDVDTHPGWSFVFPGGLSSGVTVDEMYIRAFASPDEPPGGTCVFKLLVENADPDTNTQWGSSHLPRNGSWVTTHADKSIAFSGNTWYFGEADTDPANLAADLSTLLSTYGDIVSGDRVNFAAIHQSGGYVGMEDFAHAGSNEAELSITYTVAAGGAPAVTPQRRASWIRR